MALRYRVLEKFSQEAREYAASRVYDQPVLHGRGRSCADGRCVFGNLMYADGFSDDPLPGGMYVADSLDLDSTEEVYEVMQLNDKGELATPEAVRALLLGDTTPTGAAAAGVGA